MDLAFFLWGILASLAHQGELCQHEPLLHQLPSASHDPQHFVSATSRRIPSLAALWWGCFRQRACHHLQPLKPLAARHCWDRGRAEGDRKKDSSVRGKETPTGSVTAACSAPSVSIKGTPWRKTVLKKKSSRCFPAKTVLWAAPPLRKTCQNLAGDL